MAFKMKGYPMKDNGTTGITEEQYKSLTAERKALSGK